MSSRLETEYFLTRYDSFGIILDECPRAGELLEEYGLHCSSCFLNEHDSVEIGADRHGMTEDEMLEMLEEVNAELKKEWDAQQKETGEK
jgi:hypothetical protein